MLELFPFLVSNRFWKIVIAALAIFLGSYGILPQEVVTFIVTVTGLSVTVRTVDRLGEKLGKK